MALPGLEVARHVPLVVLTRGGEIVHVTDEAMHLLGDRASLVGRPWRSCVAPVPDPDEYVRMCAATLDPIPGAFQRDVAGTLVRFRCDGYRAGDHLVLHVRRRDPYDRFLELARELDEAERANRAKDDLIAMLGHELRNPLAPILTALQLMEYHGGGGDRERRVIERHVKHMMRLVDDLLDLAEITHGTLELAREAVELDAIVDRAVELATELVEPRRRDLAIVVERGLIVWADPARLAQALANVLRNSLKYSAAGTPIELCAAREGEAIVIRVRDRGVGIAPEVLPRVFEAFVQEPQALDRARGGLGLGLAIVHSLIALHDGQVEVASAGNGRGTEVTIRLPAAPRDPAASGRDSGAPRPTRSLRILVVDDNVDAAEMMAELLEAQGHSTRIAHDAAGALAAVAELAPEVALVDIGLPGTDGYELARELRARVAGIRLVAITGYGQPGDRRRSSEAGFDAHLVKPVSFDELEAVMRATR